MDVAHISRNWRAEWLDVVAVSAGLTDDEKAEVRFEVGKDVCWLVSIPEPEVHVLRRKTKLQFLDSRDLAINFDPLYQYRISFFEYALTC